MGHTHADPDQYSMLGMFTPEFLSEYTLKEREYNCPPALRVYCSWPEDGIAGNGKMKATDAKCDTFLGRKMTTATEFMSNRASSVVACRKCVKPSCLACGKCIEGDWRTHKCLDLQAAAEPDAFEGLTRGRDYQICPSERCGRRVELSDGCNHIQCFCKMQFCFICGEPALEGNRHWSRRADGSLPACPRYNQPGAQRAMYDGPNPHPAHSARLTGFDAMMGESLGMGHRRRGAVAERRMVDLNQVGDDLSDDDFAEDLRFGDHGAVMANMEMERRAADRRVRHLGEELAGVIRTADSVRTLSDRAVRATTLGNIHTPRPRDIWARPRPIPMGAAQDESADATQHPDPLRSHPAPLDQAALDRQAAQNVEAFQELPRYYVQGGRGLLASDTPQSPRDHTQPGGPIRNFGMRTSFARDRSSGMFGNATGAMGDQNVRLLTYGNGLSRQRSTPRFHPYEMPPDRMQSPEEWYRQHEPNNAQYGQSLAGAQARSANSQLFNGMTGPPPIEPRAEVQRQQTAREHRRSALEDMRAAHLDADEPMRNRYPHGRESGTSNGAFNAPRSEPSLVSPDGEVMPLRWTGREQQTQHPSLFGQGRDAETQRTAGIGQHTQARASRYAPSRDGMLGIGNSNFTPRSNYSMRSDRADVSQAGGVLGAGTSGRRHAVTLFRSAEAQTSSPEIADIGYVPLSPTRYSLVRRSPASPNLRTAGLPLFTGMLGIGNSGTFMNRGSAGQAQLTPPSQASRMWSARATAGHETGQNERERRRMRDRRPSNVGNSHRVEPDAHHPNSRATVGSDSDAPNERTRRLLHPGAAMSTERAATRNQIGRPVRRSAVEGRPTAAPQPTTRATNRPRPSTGVRFMPVTGTPSPINERNNADPDISPGSSASGYRTSDVRGLFSTRTGQEFYQHDEPGNEPQ